MRAKATCFAAASLAVAVGPGAAVTKCGRAKWV